MEDFTSQPPRQRIHPRSIFCSAFCILKNSYCFHFSSEKWRTRRRKILVEYCKIILHTIKISLLFMLLPLPFRLGEFCSESLCVCLPKHYFFPPSSRKPLVLFSERNIKSIPRLCAVCAIDESYVREEEE